MITWTKIDIGDGEAIWYSDCLEYQIIPSIHRHVVIALFGDHKSTYWHLFDDLSSAKQWCEEQSDIPEINDELREEFKKI